MIEKVNPSHPDKIADRIAGAIVDLAYKKVRNPRIAVEILIGHGTCHVIAETSVNIATEDIEKAVHRIVGEGITLDYHEVKQDDHLARNQEGKIRCGDNGIFKGVPLTQEQTLLSRIARRIYYENHDLRDLLTITGLMRRELGSQTSGASSEASRSA